jgi:hypothetical protein
VSVWQPPTGPYPPTPHLLDHQTPPDKAVRLVISKVEDQGGEAIFIAYGRSAKRLIGKVCALLPADYQGQTASLDASTCLPGALRRRALWEVHLHVRRVGGPDRQPRFDDPQQRALDSLNPPRTSEQEPPGT